MSGYANQNVYITISTNPLSITYSPSSLTLTESTNICYIVNTSGWSIIGVGNANTAGNSKLSYNSEQLPMPVQSYGDTINCYIDTGSQTTVEILDIVDSSCTCNFSFAFTDGQQVLTHDPQVTNDPG